MLSHAALAKTIVIDIYAAQTSGNGAKLGTISATQTKHGLVFSPSLKGLTPGAHGFHVHENGSCAPAEKNGKLTPAAAAGRTF